MTSGSEATASRSAARLEIMKNAFESVADGMALTVVRTSRSSVVRSGLDFSTGLLTHRGELFGQSMCQPMHLGGMTPALEACLHAYGDDVNPGDVLINNDPYEGGSHLPDIFLFKPVYCDDVVVSYACAMAHHTDVGGRVAGGNACDNTEIYQEGLRIPPLKLYERGEPNEALFRIIEKAVRVPQTVLGDLRAQLAALEYGERELARLVERHGVAEIQTVADDLLNYTETMARRGLELLPDGSWTFTDYVDDDGISDEAIPIVVNLTKQGGTCAVDFTGTARQCRGSIQPVFTTTKAMVYCAVRHILGLVVGDIPNTEGYFRPITVTAPPGTFVNPLLPAAVAARALGCLRINQAVLGAFAQMLPDKVYACSGGCELGVSISGYDRSEIPWKPWVFLEFVNESAIGGFAYRDGEDAQVAGAANGALTPVEEIERDQPIFIEEFGLMPDSEGAGAFRGGLGLVRQYRFLADNSQLQVRADRTKHGPFGLFGGDAAGTTRITVASEGHTRDMPGKFMTELQSGDVMRVEAPGAGGWGNPLERDPSLVLDDVLEEKISVRRAFEKYGVVLSDDATEIDWKRTQSVRLERHAESAAEDRI